MVLPASKLLLDNEPAWQTRESSCRQQRNPSTIHPICLHESPHPTHHHLSPTRQAPNGHGVRKFLLEGRLLSKRKPCRCHSPSSTAMSTNDDVHGVCSFVRSSSHCAWRSHKLWNTGCRAARSSMSSGNVASIVRYYESEPLTLCILNLFIDCNRHLKFTQLATKFYL